MVKRSETQPETQTNPIDMVPKGIAKKKVANKAPTEAVPDEEKEKEMPDEEKVKIKRRRFCLTSKKFVLADSEAGRNALKTYKNLDASLILR